MNRLRGDAPHPDVHLRLLGEASVEAPGHPEAEELTAQPKRFALLVWLSTALPRGPWQRDALLPVFWPELDQARARQALRKTTYHLRRSLPDGALGAKGGESLTLRSGLVGCDVTDFETLLDEGREEAALALYRGELLPGFHLGRCPGFDRWVDVERGRLARRASLAAWLLAERAARTPSEDPGGWIGRATALQPLDEAGIRRAMRLLADGGNRGGALDVFETFRLRLHEEHEAEPSPETTALAGAIRHGRATAPAEDDRPVPPPEPAAEPTLQAAPRSVAVLPFSDLSVEGDLGWFGDGLAEEIIHRLVEAGGVRVAGRLSSFAFRGSGDAREIGARLGVDSILEGSVRADGRRFRVTSQLIRVSDGLHLWSWSVDAATEDLFEVQDEIALGVRERMTGGGGGPRGGGPPAAGPARPTVDSAAYHEYLMGRYQLERRTPASLERGAAHLRRAIELEPAFAPAHAALAECYTILPVYTDFPSVDAMPLARAAADRALALDDSLAEALGARAFATLVYEWHWEGAEAAWTRALALDPGAARLRAVYALYLPTCAGRHAEAIKHVERARAEDPLALPVIGYSGFVHMFAREFDTAIRRAEEAVDLDDEFVLGHWVLGSSLHCADRADEAVEEYRRAVDLTRGSPLMRSQLACGLAAAGDRQGAERELADLGGRGAEAGMGSAPPYFVAMAEALLGSHDHAFDLLKRAYRDRAPHLMFLNVDPRWDSLRPDRRFRELVLRIGLR